MLSFCWDKENVVIHLTFIQTSKKQNHIASWVLVAMRNWKFHHQMLFLVKNIAAHVQLDWIRKWRDMPNVAQTRRSTEPDAGVLKHDNEELMDTSSPK